MAISTDVKWEIFPHPNYRFHRIVIDWMGVSDAKNLDWGDIDNPFSSIYFAGSIALEEPEIEFFDYKKSKSSAFKRFWNLLINSIKNTKKNDGKRRLDIIHEESGFNTIIKVNLDKFDDEFQVFKKNNFTTVVTFKEGRTPDLIGSRTTEKLDFKPNFTSSSYNISFYIPKSHILKRIVHLIFNISSDSNNNVTWFPIEFKPDIKSNKFIFRIPEDKMGQDIQIWYTPKEIDSFQLLVRTAGILLIAFFQTVVQFILSIWNT